MNSKDIKTWRERLAIIPVVPTVSRSVARFKCIFDEITDLRQALEAAEAELDAMKRGAGEPVAWANSSALESAKLGRERYGNQGATELHTWSEGGPSDCHDTPLYTRPCVPLTDEQIDELWRAPTYAEREHYEFARAIEAAHGIKGAKG